MCKQYSPLIISRLCAIKCDIIFIKANDDSFDFILKYNGTINDFFYLISEVVHPFFATCCSLIFATAPNCCCVGSEWALGQISTYMLSFLFSEVQKSSLAKSAVRPYEVIQTTRVNA